MPKKKNWLHRIKRFFFREAEQQDQGKRSKKRRWLFFGKLKTIRPPPSIVAPPIVLDRERRSPEEGDSGEQRALDAAIAYAAAAEAAVAAAKKAAEVLTITTVSPNESEAIEQHYERQGLEIYEVETKCSSGITCMHEGMMQDVAAIKIQTAFRGYLARKALRALKGLVKLQAIIRGRAVRHQAVTTLKCLQSIVHIQSQIHARRSLTVHGNSHPDDEFSVQDHRRDEKLMAELSGHRKWDHSPLTKDEVNAVISNKKEAILRRERMKAYSFNYRSSMESTNGKTDGRLKYWLEEYAIRQEHKNDAFKRLDADEDKQQREVVRTKHDKILGLDSPILLGSRRSYDRKKQRSIGEENLFAGSSPLVPTYMAATESAKARVRSTSSPRLRPVHSDSFSDCNSPYKHKFSTMSSINSEVTCTGRSVKHCITTTSQQRSPGLKGLCSESESSVHGNWESGALE